MVKFNKHLKSRRISKWADKYINYKHLKQIINEIYINIRIKDMQHNKNKLESSEQNTEINLYQKNKYEIFAQRFINALEIEIRSLYHAYSNIEKDIFVKLNKILHNKKHYETLKESEILIQCQQIYLLSLDTHLYSDFVYTNLEGIRKIMKKFDKKFTNNSTFNHSFMLLFINKLLEDPNSGFNYILQFTIIDEILLLIKPTLNTLSKLLNLILIKRRATINPEDESEIKRLNDIERNSNIYIKEALSNLDQINVNGKYRMRYLNLGMFFSYENNRSIEDNEFLLGNDSEFEYALLFKEKEENIFLTKKLLSSNEFEKLKKENVNMISKENSKNIRFIFNNTIITMCYYGMNFGFVIKLLNNDYKIEQCFLGFSITMVLLGKEIGKIIFNYVLNTERYYKKALQISSLLIAISHLFLINPNYFLSESNEIQVNTEPDFGPQIAQDTQNESQVISEQKSIFSKYLILLLLTRLLLGFGISGCVERKYFKSFLPKKVLYFSTKKYYYSHLIGMIIGLLFGFAFPINIYMIVCLVLSSVLHFVYISFTFYSPTTDGFSIMKKDVQMNSMFNYKSNEMIVSDNMRDPSANLTEEDLTKEENKHVKETNERLNEINAKNRFSDTNLVAKNISDIVNDYKKRQNKIFMVIMFIISVSEFIIMAFQILFQVLVIYNNDQYYKITIVFPFVMFYPIDRVIKLFGKKKFLNQLLTIQVMLLLIMICLSILAIDLFSLFYLIIIPINLIIQKKVRRFIALTFEQDVSIKCININTLVHLFICLSGSLGAVFPFILKKVFKVNYTFEDDNEVIWYSFCFSIISCVFVFLAYQLYKKNINYNRIKMISRIIKRKLV